MAADFAPAEAALIVSPVTPSRAVHSPGMHSQVIRSPDMGPPATGLWLTSPHRHFAVAR